MQGPTVAAVVSLGIGCAAPLKDLFFPVQVGSVLCFAYSHPEFGHACYG
jgi:hypothetical protein